jgi:hypothetical protein
MVIRDHGGIVGDVFGLASRKENFLDANFTNWREKDLVLMPGLFQAIVGRSKVK